MNYPGILEVAVVGYDPKKPGRPSHTYHTYKIASLRLIMEVECRLVIKVRRHIRR
jgi:hypothetical protein